MTTRLASALALLAGAGLLAGCGDAAGPPQAAPVKVSGKVVLADGKPVRDVKLTFLPTDAGTQAAFKLGADGRFSGDMVPAKYLFYFDAVDGKEVALKAIPGPYQTTSNDHTVEVKAGAELVVTVR